MAHLKVLQTTVCLAALASASTAIADVTAQQVWDDWKDQFSMYGEDTVSIGSETAANGSVTVSDISFAFAEDGAEGTFDIGTIVFEEQRDGTVKIVMEETFPFTMTGEDGMSIAMTMTQSGMDLTASGDKSEINYDISADRYAFSVDQIQEYDSEIDADIRFVANGISGSYQTKTGNARMIDYDIATESVDVFVDVTDPESNGAFLLSGKIENLGADLSMVAPLGVNLADVEDMFGSGVEISGNYSFGSSSYLFDGGDGSSMAKGTVGTGAGVIDFALGGETLAYDVTTNDISVGLTSSDFPFPVNLTLAQYGVGFEMPLVQTEEPADFGLKFNLTDLAVNEEIWMLGDPTGALPHDPATVNLDLGGSIKLFFDLTDPEQADALGMTDVPGELHTLNLNDLTLAFAGALVKGQGGFVFDNEDLATFDGFPRPEGEITLNIDGANKLIDTLVEMGYVPEDQAMMGRMMMGMFARTVGDDQLTSTVSVNDQGHVLANGQRVR